MHATTKIAKDTQTVGALLIIFNQQFGFPNNLSMADPSLDLTPISPYNCKSFTAEKILNLKNLDATDPRQFAPKNIRKQ